MTTIFNVDHNDYRGDYYNAANTRKRPQHGNDNNGTADSPCDIEKITERGVPAHR